MTLIKLNFSYMLNKITLLVIFISLIIFVVGLLLFGNVFISDINKQMYHEIYLNEYTNNVKIIYNIIIFVSIMIFNHSFNKAQDSYVLVVITRGISRFKYFIYKVISVIILISLYNLVLLLLLLIISRLNNYYFSDIKFFSLVYLQSIVYGLISLSITQILNSSMTNIIVVITYWINEILVSFKVKYLHIVIPHLIKEKNEFYFGIKYVIIYMLIIILLNSYLYSNKELN